MLFCFIHSYKIRNKYFKLYPKSVPIYKVQLTFVKRLVLLLKEYWYALKSYYVLPLAFLPNFYTKHRNKNTAVILIHGYARNKLDLDWIYKKTPKDLAIFAVNLHPIFGSIEDITRDSFAPFITKIQTKYNFKSIILIGHSMGGLVSTYYQEFMNKSIPVKGIITLGTPYGGSEFLKTVPGVNAKEMHPGSHFLDVIRKSINRNSNFYFQIASKGDSIITPWDSAYLDFLPNEHILVLEHENHFTMLHSNIVLATLNSWIKEINSNI